MTDTTILTPDYLLPRPDATALRKGTAIAVAGDRTAAIADPTSLIKRYPHARVIPLPDCIVMPGLVNAHQHGRGLSQIQLGYRDTFLESWIIARRGRGALD